MELSDVVDAQVAVPVVGVVVCAVLVFAFGFKAPVQPPSFDALNEDERKSKRGRTRKIGSGVTHIGDKKLSAGSSSSDDDEPTSSQPSKLSKLSVASGTSQPGTAARAYVGTTVIDASSLDKLQQKAFRATDNLVQPVDTSVKEDRAVGIGGWTTAVSKRDKKNRNKKDENVKPDKVVVSTGSPKLSSGNRENVAKGRKDTKKVSELASVTVVVTAPSSSHSSAPETSTTITDTAVIKLKVMPNTRSMPSSNTSANGHAVLIDRKPTAKPAVVVSPSAAGNSRYTTTVAPWANYSDAGAADKPLVAGLGEEDWVEVSSSRSPQRRRQLVDGSQAAVKKVGVSQSDKAYVQLSSAPEDIDASEKATQSSDSGPLVTANADSGRQHGDTQHSSKAVDSSIAASSRSRENSENVEDANELDVEKPEDSGDWQEAKAGKNKKKAVVSRRDL